MARMEQLKELAGVAGDTKGTAHSKHRGDAGVQMVLIWRTQLAGVIDARDHHKDHRDETNESQVEIVRDDKTCRLIDPQVMLVP